MSARTPVVGVTQGDPAGIGPEICLDLLSARDEVAFAPLVFGDAAVLRAAASAVGKPPPHSILSAAEWCGGASAPSEGGVVDLGSDELADLVPGRVDARTGRASFRYIDEAIRAVLARRVDAVATGPVHKVALRAAGVPFPGHTELFAERTGASRVCMMLASDRITCSLATAHVGLRDVAGSLSRESVESAITLTAAAVQRMRGRPARLGVLGLNPHAGEGGLFGDREEERVIVPAIEAARAAGIFAEGPLPPDTAFLPERLARTDAFVCMYHDQGLIPLKMLAFDTAVNITLGLPIVRTSVDHGTALDIAWKGVASSRSLLEAARLAAILSNSPEPPTPFSAPCGP